MTEPMPTYTVAPAADPSTLVAEHLEFLRGLRGHTWVSDYIASPATTERLLQDVFDYLTDRLRAEGWI